MLRDDDRFTLRGNNKVAQIVREEFGITSDTAQLFFKTAGDRDFYERLALRFVTELQNEVLPRRRG